MINDSEPPESVTVQVAVSRSCTGLRGEDHSRGCTGSPEEVARESWERPLSVLLHDITSTPTRWHPVASRQRGHPPRQARALRTMPLRQRSPRAGAVWPLHHLCSASRLPSFPEDGRFLASYLSAAFSSSIADLSLRARVLICSRRSAPFVSPSLARSSVACLFSRVLLFFFPKNDMSGSLRWIAAAEAGPASSSGW